jgi:hypothetical protein
MFQRDANSGRVPAVAPVISTLKYSTAVEISNASISTGEA